MKKIINKSWALIVLTAFLVSFFGCNDAENSAVEGNMVYIKDAYVEKFGEVYVEDGFITNLTIPIGQTRMLSPEDSTIVQIEYSPDILDEFNKRYGKDYRFYPLDQWTSEKTSVVINKQAVSASLSLDVQSFTQDQKDSGNVYAIPITISSADKAGVMQGSETLIYVLRKQPIATVASIANGDQYLRLDMSQYGEEIVVSEMTLEFLFNINAPFRTTNNHVMFYNNNGTPNSFFTRLEGGSGGLDNAEFEVKMDADVINAVPAGSGKFEVDKWYHIAVVNTTSNKCYVYINGIRCAYKEIPTSNMTLRTPLSVGTDSRWFGFNWGGGNIGATKVAEIRFWNKARTAEQIKENMYSVASDSEGLLGYWKVNDGIDEHGIGYNVANSIGGPTAPTGYANNRVNLTWYPEQRLNVN